MATDPTLDRVRELMGKHGMLPDPVLAKFVTVLPKTACWRKLSNGASAYVREVEISKIVPPEPCEQDPGSDLFKMLRNAGNQPAVDRTRAIIDKRALQAKANVDTPDDVIHDAWQALEQQSQAALESVVLGPTIGIDLAKEGSDRTVLMRSRSLGKTCLFNDALQAATDRIAMLEAENDTLRAQLAGKVSISCADAAAVLTAMPPLVPATVKPAIPSTALAHRKPQIGLRTL